MLRSENKVYVTREEIKELEKIRDTLKRFSKSAEDVDDVLWGDLGQASFIVDGVVEYLNGVLQTSKET